MKPTPMINAGLIFNGLRYWLTGGMRIKNGHLPTVNYEIAADFLGVCVASCGDTKGDDLIIENLLELGVKRVRIDVREDDLTVLKCQFLEKLFQHQFNVCLHVVQPISQARVLPESTALLAFEAFLQNIISQFGSKIQALEFATTINRKTWAGYTETGFLAAWAIVYEKCQAKQIQLIGPNVQDFEPFYNRHLLKKLKQNNQLPNFHSNNLFAERTIEPERYDHRVFKYTWTRWLKINLVKKARIIQKIGAELGVPQLVSSNAFWANFRILRLLPDAKQKQADYLTRYFVLLAASGAVTHANWGALICQREGLIDNGLNDADYPPLEQVAYYGKAHGNYPQFVPNPSFFAFKTVAKFLQNALYLNAIASTNGLEIHALKQADKTIHVAWTINGKIAFLADIYAAASLEKAMILHRDGQVLLSNQTHITETPIYLVWQKDVVIEHATKPVLPQSLIVHQHVQGLQYFRLQKAGWDGLILAKTQTEADLIAQTLDPETLAPPAKNNALRHARNAIWAVADPRDATKQLTIKQPVKMYPHKALLDRFKPSKGKRSWNGAMQLLRHGIGTAMPVAYFEKMGDTTCKQNFYVCEFVKAETNVGQLFASFANGETHWNGIASKEIVEQVAEFCLNMHQRLLWFRDLSGGNILVNLVDGKLQFSLIDTARLRTVLHPPFPHSNRLSDMTRVCHKLNWSQRDLLMRHYFGLQGKKFTWFDKLKFYLYDFKVGLKRTIGRKGIKKLLNRFKSNT